MHEKDRSSTRIQMTLPNRYKTRADLYKVSPSILSPREYLKWLTFWVFTEMIKIHNWLNQSLLRTDHPIQLQHFWWCSKYQFDKNLGFAEKKCTELVYQMPDLLCFDGLHSNNRLVCYFWSLFGCHLFPTWKVLGFLVCAIFWLFGE